MNWRILLACSLAFLSLNAAHAGSNTARLSYKSESGKVELKGDLPASESGFNLILGYNGKSLKIGYQNGEPYIVEHLRKGVFTLLIKLEKGDDVEHYALPNTVVNLRIPGSDMDFDFDAMLTGPRPGGPFEENERSVNPLKATLKCRYHYSI